MLFERPDKVHNVFSIVTGDQSLPFFTAVTASVAKHAISGIRCVMTQPSPKPVVWLGDTLATLRACPQEVQDQVGYALYLAQIGAQYERAKPLKGVGPGVLEVIADHRGDTYRAVYTVRFAERVYVLDVFQKKSKKGIATPQSDIKLVRHRLKRAAELDRKREH
jgi:phage-related protein